MRRQFDLSGMIWAFPYYLAAYASAVLSAGTVSGDLASIWLSAGVAMAALMLTPPSGWLAVAASLVAAQTLFGLVQGASVVHALAVAIVLIAAPVVALAVVVRFARVPLHGLYFLRALFLAALIASVPASVIELSHQNGPMFDFSSHAVLRGIAHFVGIFVVTPVFTAWSRFRPSRQVQHGMTERLIGACAFLAFVPCAMLAFEATWFHDLSNNLAVGLSYVPLVLCVLISLMWDARGGALSVFLLAIIALSQTMTGHGPFAWTADATSMIGVQIYLAVASVLMLFSTTLHGNREKALEHARRWRTNMELALAGSGQLVYCLDTKSGHFEWGGDVETITGHNAEALATLDAVLAAISPEDRARARTRWLRAAVGSPSGDMTFLLRMRDDSLVRLTDISTPVDDMSDGPAFIAGTWRKAANAHGTHDAPRPSKESA